MAKNSFKISVVVPCYNEASNIPFMLDELQAHLSTFDYEIILVDDGSRDGSHFIIELQTEKLKEVNYIRFTRNFGHQAALQAGIVHACGDAIITIDADMQQPPSVIPEMIDKWIGGAMIVEAIPVYTNSVGWFKKYSSFMFYKVLNQLSEYPIVKSANDFRLIDKKVADIIRQLPENHLYLRGLYSWMGFDKDFVSYNHLKRLNGQSHYPLAKMVKLGLNGITSLSVRPLRLAIVMGLVVSIIAFAIIIWAIYLAVFTDKTIQGWTSVIVSTVFLAGMQLIVLGIFGEYLGKLFIENKRRPNYVILNKSFKRSRKESEIRSLR